MEGAFCCVTKYKRIKNDEVIALKFCPNELVDNVIKEFGSNPIMYDDKNGYYIIIEELIPGEVRNRKIHRYSSIIPINVGDYILKENGSFTVLSEKEFLKQYKQVVKTNVDSVFHIHNHFNINMGNCDEVEIEKIVSGISTKLKEVANGAF